MFGQLKNKQNSRTVVTNQICDPAWVFDTVYDLFTKFNEPLVNGDQNFKYLWYGATWKKKAFLWSQMKQNTTSGLFTLATKVSESDGNPTALLHDDHFCRMVGTNFCCCATKRQNSRRFRRKCKWAFTHHIGDTTSFWSNSQYYIYNKAPENTLKLELQKDGRMVQLCAITASRRKNPSCYRCLTATRCGTSTSAMFPLQYACTHWYCTDDLALCLLPHLPVQWLHLHT